MERIIDTHTHFNHNVLGEAPEQEIYRASLSHLQEQYKTTGIESAICSTFASVYSADWVEQENEYLFNLVQNTQWLYQWVVIDPRNPKTYRQAEHMLCNNKCIGIKLHPVNHHYDLLEHSDALFSFASHFHATVQIHPEHTDASYILPVANRYPNVNFIMAHIWEKGHVDAIEYADHGNVYVDTSGRASINNNIIEYAVSRVGSTHILFGTDTYAAGSQKGRIEYALISDADKKNIFINNAKRLLKLD